MAVEPHPPLEVPDRSQRDDQSPGRPRHDPANWTLAAGFALVATLVGLIVLAWFILFVTKGRFLKPTFESVASRWTGRQVQVAGDFNFYFDIIDARFKADGLSISNPGWASRPDF